MMRLLAIMTMVLLTAWTAPAHARVQAVPPELQLTGYKLLFTAEAHGVQIYTSTADSSGAVKWMLEAPLAELVAQHGKLKLHHYAGPSWEADDGSKVARDADTPVKSAPAPHGATDIPWLLVKVTADPAPGVLAKVAYVQRIATHGGAAPVKAPSRAGTKIGVTDVVKAVPDLVKALSDAGLSIWKAYHDANKERRTAILSDIEQLRWRSLEELAKP